MNVRPLLIVTLLAVGSTAFANKLDNTAANRSSQAKRLAATLLPEGFPQNLQGKMAEKLPESMVRSILHAIDTQAITQSLADYFEENYTADDLKLVADFRTKNLPLIKENASASMVGSQFVGIYLMTKTVPDTSQVQPKSMRGGFDTAENRQREAKRLVEATVSSAQLQATVESGRQFPQYKKLPESRKRVLDDFAENGTQDPRELHIMKDIYLRVYSAMCSADGLKLYSDFVTSPAGMKYSNDKQYLKVLISAIRREVSEAVGKSL